MSTPNNPGDQFPQQGDPNNWQGNPPAGEQLPPAADQQYAQPGYQQGQPYSAPAAEPKPAKGGLVGRIIKGVVVIVVLVGVGLLARALLTDAFNTYEELEPGKCIVFEGTVDNLKHKAVDCDDASQFKYEIAKTFGENKANECGDDYGWYSIEKERFGVSSGTIRTVCIVEKFEAGACYEQVEGVEDFKLISCPAELGPKQFKVNQVIEQANATCADGELPVTYPYPEITYCVATS